MVVLRLTVTEIEVGPNAPGETLAIVPGPWAVDLAVPVAPAHRAILREITVADGLALTLEEVIVTPLETRLCVRGLTRWDEEKSLPQPVITGAGAPLLSQQPPVRTYPRDDGVTVYQVATAPDLGNEWMVTFQFDPRAARPEEVPDPRSWTFRVVLTTIGESREVGEESGVESR